MHKDKHKGPDDVQRDDTDSHDGPGPAHWQGEPLPKGHGEQTQDIGFDRRGAGRARQYGRAGVYGQRHNDQESRPSRGAVQPDESLLGAVRDAFRQSGVDVATVVVMVERGVIHLDGHIASRDEKYKLERLAANCPGTVAVRNRLEVT